MNDRLPKSRTRQTTTGKNVNNESDDDDERYCLTLSRFSDKMADDDDATVATGFGPP